VVTFYSLHLCLVFFKDVLVSVTIQRLCTYYTKPALFNSLYFNFYKSKSSSDHVYSSDSGATLRLLNTYDKFNFFNEVVYRSDYLSSNNTKIDSGFDYSLGVTYKFNKKISLSFKGENILNNAIKNPVTKVGAVSNIDKKFMLGMEYSF